jgi:hypothetical protein
LFDEIVLAQPAANELVSSAVGSINLETANERQ